jgi:hypothetical protein
LFLADLEGVTPRLFDLHLLSQLALGWVKYDDEAEEVLAKFRSLTDGANVVIGDYLAGSAGF